jgi:hypothetical protein
MAPAVRSLLRIGAVKRTGWPASSAGCAWAINR